jgi:hypothetical protein
MRDLSLHILDIAENSIRAGARCIEVNFDLVNTEILRLTIADDGKGMDEEQLKSARDPFYTTRTTRAVGLGLPLLSQKAEQAGGAFEICAEPGMGTDVVATFRTTHPDCPPEGDVPECAWLLMAVNPERRIRFSFTCPDQNWLWDSTIIRDTLEGLSMADNLVKFSVIGWFNSDFEQFCKKIVRT